MVGVLQFVTHVADHKWLAVRRDTILRQRAAAVLQHDSITLDDSLKQVLEIALRLEQVIKPLQSANVHELEGVAVRLSLRTREHESPMLVT